MVEEDEKGACELDDHDHLPQFEISKERKEVGEATEEMELFAIP